MRILFLAISFMAMGRYLKCKCPVVPKTCKHEGNILLCSIATGADLGLLTKCVLNDIDVDFIVFEKGGSTCQCYFLKMLEKLRFTDIAVLARKSCSLKKYKKCGYQAPVKGYFSVAGLVVSMEDSKMKWAIQRHVIEIWHQLEDIKDIRSKMKAFKGVIKDLEGAKSLLLKEGIRKDSEDEIAELPVQGNTDRINEMLGNAVHRGGARERFPHMFPEVASSIQESMELLNQVKEITTRPKEKDNAQLLHLKTAVEMSEDELDEVLKLELSRIAKDLKQHKKDKQPSRGKRKVKKAREKSILKIPKTADGAYDRPSLPSRKGKHQSVPKHKKKERVELGLHLLPYKVFIGGDFVSLFDRVGMDFLASTVVETPDTKADRKLVTKRPLPEERSRYSNNTDVGDEDLGDDEDDLLGDLLHDGGKLKAEMANAAAAGFAAAAQGGLKKTTGPKKQKAKTLKNSTATARKKEKAKTTKDEYGERLKEQRKRGKDEDHRLKSLIVFFVAIVCILAVIGVLIFMACKRRNYFTEDLLFKPREKLTLEEQRRRRQALLQMHEDRFHKKNPVYETYEDNVGHYGQVNGTPADHGDRFNSIRRIPEKKKDSANSSHSTTSRSSGRRSNSSSKDKKNENNLDSQRSMDAGRLKNSLQTTDDEASLGGKHIVTEFVN